MLIDPKHDAMGAAIKDYFETGRAKKLRVLSSMFDEDEMSVPYLFRSWKEMPPLERKALQMARGKVLDVGAGAGCHSLSLQDRGIDVTAVDISSLSCEVMIKRGVRNVLCKDVMSPDLTGSYDTILLLMNGIGMAGTIERLPQLLRRLKDLLADGGQIITDSSDIKYVFENEDGSMDIDLAAGYYGEVDYQIAYAEVMGDPFDWLYIEYDLLQAAANAVGLSCDLAAEGNHYDYLAVLHE